MTTDRTPEPDGRPPAPPPDAPPPDAPPPDAAPPLRWAEEPPPARAGLARRAARYAATALIFAAALLGALVIWDYYILAPWTRDGTVRVQVANVAPQVSGQITEVRIVDNQYVKRGEVLYVIDPFDYRVKLASAKANVKQSAADYQVKREQAKRLLALGTAATTAQQQQAAVGAADAAEATFQQAQQQQDQAEINLRRTQVTSPVNGFVTNLLMRVGDFAATGDANVSVIDTDSYWIDGYFEETKLGRICVGDRAEAQLMGFAAPIVGKVDTITRGIAVSNAASGTQGLPSVNAVYTWVRLAQRVPVRVRITEVPPGVPLVSGLTATVTVRKGAAGAPGPLAALTGRVRDVFAPPAPSPDCIPPTLGGTGPVARLPEPQPTPAQTPEQIAPGLADGLTAKPQQP
ncbi:HlyD family secretion protein [Methylobacterium sp. NEAU 140]|uniref:biotin/lipoyl-binding protein n=1 Tax=Methylobacterium sp. NEAU 140 TaxID=3064945 RepID=UPI002733D0C0|nr:HlyD family secretion protein [Methylobacterium sp. NEAU 140]MDP4025934.1 HlyD family secretion protein [Methylobacterium sp. NEAU 140]